VRVPREALEELRGKYAEMLAMRVEHASGSEDPSAVRRRMAALAARFPGSLREIDDLELQEIRRRVAALDGVLADGRGVEPWMEAVALFHALARGALVAKKWLAGRKRIDRRALRSYAETVSSLPFPEDARQWAAELGRVASPPRGRVTALVFARLARELGVSEREARRRVFSARREAVGRGDPGD
jgi:hypothetical protein